MSRLIVKNLPNGIKEDRLRDIFGSKGTLTDCSLKYTKNGKFRKFAFVGFRDPKEAAAAVKELNNTFLDTSKICVEYAKDFGDYNKPRSWSKYSYDSSTYQKMMKEKEDKKEKLKKEKKPKEKDKALDEMLGELKNDPKFEEFLEAHQRSKKKSVWDNDAMETSLKKKASSKVKVEDEDSAVEMKSDENSDDNEDDYDEIEENKRMEEREVKEGKGAVATEKNVSDLEYLRSKVTSKNLSDSSDDDSDDDDKDDDIEDDSEEADDDEDDSSDQEKEKEKSGKGMISGKGKISGKDTSKDVEKQKKEEEQDVQKFTVKMRGLPLTVGEKAVKEFFDPIIPLTIRIPKSAKRRPIGIAYVDFKTSKEMEQVMGRNKNFIKDKRIFLKKCEASDMGPEVEKQSVKESESDVTRLQKEVQEGVEESIAETGRLYIRNLPYLCTEEDLETLFKAYGPLTEVHLPIDTFTKKIKGFAFVTYMIPEHAVKAFSELDGTSFMGRMLHILPAREKNEEVEEKSEGSSFKNQKKKKEKQQAGSSHNWNTLFLGANAVADVMAEKYNTEKSHILDAEGRASLGVRMALGETQLVAETRQFLVDNGVVLDSFSQAAGERSKTVLLVKNLPARTDVEELRALFSKYGSIGRIILPPSGMTAVVEYLEPTEAKAGFRNLAYSKFHHVPLYLEWAPMEALKAEEQVKKEKTDKEMEKIAKEKEQVEEDADAEEDGVEPDSTLFVKNLNFDTTEDSLQEVFCKCGEVRQVTIARKKDTKKPGQLLSMGYGFVEYKKQVSAQKALKKLQHTEIDGHTVELKVSNRTTAKMSQTQKPKKKQKEKKQQTSKILVRNIPFEAKKKEIFELFKVFGEVKSVRLPKKLSGTGSHRGFGFVDFLTRQDAKRAFDALCHSTHLYGRRLVLEWAESAEDVDELRKKTAEHFHEDVPRKRVKKSAIIDTLQNSVADV